jgi:hypothetical protein
VVGLDVLEQFLLEFGDFTGDHFVQEAPDTGVNHANLFLGWHWHLFKK